MRKKIKRYLTFQEKENIINIETLDNDIQKGRQYYEQPSLLQVIISQGCDSTKPNPVLYISSLCNSSFPTSTTEQ